MERETLYTNESNVHRWENGQTFHAVRSKDVYNTIEFTVSKDDVIEESATYVVIDTSNDADL